MKNNIVDQKPDKNNNEKNIKNSNNDTNTTKEDESFITDEVISYCSSPNVGLVSINRINNINDTFTPNPSEKNNITNTITMNIAMLKKEMNSIEKERLSIRSSMFCKNENDSTESRELCIKYNEKLKIGKSIFNDKEFSHSGKIKHYANTPKNVLFRETFDNFAMDYNKRQINKRMSKIKRKKKSRKNQEKFEGHKKRERRLSLGMITDNMKKRKKKKKKNKKISAKKLQENEKEEDKGGHSPNIIILDFSSSENNEDSEESCKKNNDESKSNDSDKKNKSFIEKENNEHHNEKRKISLL